MKKYLFFIALLLAMWFIVGPYLGISNIVVAGFVPLAVILGVALALTLDYFGLWKVFPFRLKKNIAGILLLVLWAVTIYYGGWFGQMFPTGAVTPRLGPTVQPVTPTGCKESVSAEIRGTTATLDLNAWDLESNTPRSSAIDFGANCWYYKNGNFGENYVNASTDTSGGTASGFSVGDTIYIYCGGTTYYGEAVEGVCIDTQRFSIGIDAHTIVSETDMAITGYDDTGSTALTAGATNQDDYTMSQGAGGEDAIYIKLKNNVANKAYQFCGWGIAKFYNISDVTPQNEESTYTKIPTPKHLESISINTNESVTQATADSFITADYNFWKASSPIMLHEWDWLKEQFVVEADDTYDPISWDDTSNSHGREKFNGFAIMAKDCAYNRGADGRVYLDVYTHDTSAADVGLAENETSPLGKKVGVLIEVA